MTIGAIIIHSASSTRRLPYVNALKAFFKDTEVELNIIEGVFVEKGYTDAREGMEYNTISRGHTGCSLAHMNALKLAIDKNYDYAFIFEDDVEVVVKSYSELKEWIGKIKVDYDLLFLTNVGIHVGDGHDGRYHYKTVVDDLIKCSNAYGTQAYYASREILKTMYNFQKKAADERKIYVADGLAIHCEKSRNIFLNTYTVKDTDRFFKHEGFEHSILRNLN